MDAIEKRVSELLASCLDEWGHHQEAENVREGEDLESYELELRLIGQLLRFGFETGSGREAAAPTPPEGYVMVQETQLRHLLSDAITSVEFIAGRGQSKPLSRRVRDQAWALVELIPARRKVP
ncbi:hypothetical protein I5V28_16095 [Stenotrophomonas maltophilia]|uniref:hypothetical protein n=1 Tax=Stenotrophomonas maltophilia group sp. Smal32 TaxID=3377164 RepID=UPI0018D45E0E|nr:hypothetical protein [Stenotrophomonas maltophilia]MBH1747338.1 hypothetical protein [Stenotrophomonas maltophilia]